MATRWLVGTAVDVEHKHLRATVHRARGLRGRGDHFDQPVAVEIRSSQAPDLWRISGGGRAGDPSAIERGGVS